MNFYYISTIESCPKNYKCTNIRLRKEEHVFKKKDSFVIYWAKRVLFSDILVLMNEHKHIVKLHAKLPSLLDLCLNLGATKSIRRVCRLAFVRTVKIFFYYLKYTHKNKVTRTNATAHTGSCDMDNVRYYKDSLILHKNGTLWR